ncbi:MAG: NADH-quinone oxidoreductase subunit C [Desulfovibrio sp.]|jgi:Ni,Fe-hydrogenase III component G|nr:NADH-quinone oxidoreductase subunit C [Desulfovibrio sp.]
MEPRPTPAELREILNNDLRDAVSLTPSWTTNAYGNQYGWLRLPRAEDLPAAVAALAARKARLCTVSAYAEQRGDREKRRSIAYHFALDSVLLTLTVRIYDPDTLEALPVPSITPWFRNADWNEREFKEMFNIDIINHPNPRRLFLDERLDAGIMTGLIPFSSLLHSAGSKDLWERVMAEKAGLLPRPAREAGEIVEPAFTPVERTGPENTAAAAPPKIQESP